MEQKERITVAIPIYRVEAYLPKCVESVRQQTYPDLEILLIDDGSDDTCPQLCDQYAKEDARIRVIHQKNRGRSGARNTALEKAQGAYLLFVDGDDWIDSDCVETLYREAVREGADLVVGRYREIYKDGRIDHGTSARLVMTGQEPLEFYVRGKGDFQNVNSVCVKLYRRDLVQGIRFEEGKYYEDILFVTQCYAASRKCVYLDRSLYNYNIGTPTSITFSGVNELTFRDEIPAFYEKERFLKSLGREDLAGTYAFFRYDRLLTYYRDCKAQHTAEAEAYAKRIKAQICSDRKQIRMLCKMGEGSRFSRLGLKLFLVSAPLYGAYMGCMKKLAERKAQA